MTRGAFEHITRAVASITNTTHVLWVGSQSLLGAIPEPPAELASSQEGGVVPLDAPELANLVEGSIGEMSPFQITFGYWAHAVGLSTSTLPCGWRDRLIRVCNVNTRGAVALCLSPNDLAVSKLAAARPKDIDFLRAMAAHKLINVETVIKLSDDLDPATAKEGDTERIHWALAILGWCPVGSQQSKPNNPLPRQRGSVESREKQNPPKDEQDLGH